MRWAFGLTPILPLLGMFALFGLIGNIPGTVWVLYGQDKYQWNGMLVGLSLAAFGAWHAGSQAFLTGPVIARLGESRTILFGICLDVIAFVLIGFATQGWMVFVIAPFFAMSGIALQSLTTNHVSDDRQGELQGVARECHEPHGHYRSTRGNGGVRIHAHAVDRRRLDTRRCPLPAHDSRIRRRPCASFHGARVSAATYAWAVRWRRAGKGALAPCVSGA